MAERKKAPKEKSIEEILLRLEKINEQLASENFPLEDALTLYAEGAELVSLSMKKLESAKLKMEEIALVIEKNDEEAIGETHDESDRF